MGSIYTVIKSIMGKDIISSIIGFIVGGILLYLFLPTELAISITVIIILGYLYGVYESFAVILSDQEKDK